jgi:hypothetical protein
MSPVNRRQIFRNAWRIARNAASRHGGRPAQYIAQAMGMAWALLARANLPRLAGQIGRIQGVVRANAYEKEGRRRIYIELGDSTGDHARGIGGVIHVDVPDAVGDKKGNIRNEDTLHQIADVCALLA